MRAKLCPYMCSRSRWGIEFVGIACSSAIRFIVIALLPPVEQSVTVYLCVEYHRNGGVSVDFGSSACSIVNIYIRYIKYSTLFYFIYIYIIYNMCGYFRGKICWMNW